jgi:hypothetical protein
VRLLFATTASTAAATLVSPLPFLLLPTSSALFFSFVLFSSILFSPSLASASALIAALYERDICRVNGPLFIRATIAIER